MKNQKTFANRKVFRYISAPRRTARPSRSGEVSERLKEHAWKVCIREIVSWVRIPPSPPLSKLKALNPNGFRAFSFSRQSGLHSFRYRPRYSGRCGVTLYCSVSTRCPSNSCGAMAAASASFAARQLSSASQVDSVACWSLPARWSAICLFS